MFSVDHYDDPSILGGLPEDLKQQLSKTAADLSDRLRGLADDEFALVLYVDGDTPQKFRKFACVDAGNTALSALALLQNQNRLPEEAVKLAAENILYCCQAFNLSPAPELEKLAGTQFPNPEGNIVLLSEKQASGKTLLKSLTTGKKIYDPSKLLQKQTKKLTKKVKVASEEIHVDPKAALHYYHDHFPFLTGWEKRALAKHIIESAPMMKVPADVEKYAADTYAPDLVEAVALRQAMCVTQGEEDEDFRKTAAARDSYRNLLHRKDELEPADFATELGRLDEAYGLADKVPNAVYSTFGKVAQESKVIYTDGVNSITEEQLEWLCTTKLPFIEGHFGNHLAEELRKNPKTIFDSLPRPQKSILSRMASQLVAEDGVQL